MSLEVRFLSLEVRYFQTAFVHFSCEKEWERDHATMNLGGIGERGHVDSQARIFPTGSVFPLFIGLRSVLCDLQPNMPVRLLECYAGL